MIDVNFVVSKQLLNSLYSLKPWNSNLKAIHTVLLCLATALTSLDSYPRSNVAYNDDISLEVVAELYPEASHVLPVESPIPHLVVSDGTQILGYSSRP